MLDLDNNRSSPTQPRSCWRTCCKRITRPSLESLNATGDRTPIPEGPLAARQARPGITPIMERAQTREARTTATMGAPLN
jgi:hypothetical protein